jgi:hypothetical protein
VTQGNTYEELCISSIASGGAVEDIDRAIAEAVVDCLDVNKPAGKKRRVQLTVDLIPDDTGEKVGIVYGVVKKFPPETSGIEVAHIQKSTKKGFVSAPQMTIEEQLAKQAEQDRIDPVTGEVLDQPTPLRKEGTEND